MICFDSSVAAKWFFSEEHSAGARALLRASVTSSDTIIAPHMLPSEMTNIVRQRMRRGSLSHDGAQAVLAELLALPIELMAPPGLYGRALEIANTHNLPAVYDAHYVALAEMAGATFWSADQRLLRALNGAFPFIRSISDYSAS